MKPKIFLDCDGVLADFDKRAEELFGMNPREFEKTHGQGRFWSRIHRDKDFYFELDLKPDAMELYEAVRHLNPTILTGYPNGMKAAIDQKHRWAEKHFGKDQPIITCLSRDKSQYMSAGDVIVDDWPQHQPLWEEKGGVWVLHTSAADSIRQLRELNIL